MVFPGCFGKTSRRKGVVFLKRKILCLLLAILLLGVGLTGCVGDEEDSGETDGKRSVALLSRKSLL